METHIIFCSACDRDVAVVIRADENAEQTDITTMKVLCTELGATCTGTFCPICASSIPGLRDEVENLRAQAGRRPAAR